MNDKIRAVIIDDEETAIDNLCFELKKYPWISVEGIAYNGKAGIRLLEKACFIFTTNYSASLTSAAI